ncbi:MAG: cache domain-containing protein [Elusimicrobia bacterium]|nr:cache domain-containing protein [Elusimicrobiota bacterium]
MAGLNKYKFIGAVIFIFLVPFLILSSHFLSYNQELAKKDSLLYLELKTRILAKFVSDNLNLNYDIHKLAKEKEFLNASVWKKKEILEKKLREHSGKYIGFLILEPSGKKAAEIGKGKIARLKDYSREEIFKNTILEKTSQGAVEYRLDSPPVLVISEPLAKSGGKIENVILSEMSLAYLNEAIKTSPGSYSGDFGLVDSGGQIIVDSKGKSVISPGLKAQPQVLELMRLASMQNLSDFRSEMISNAGGKYLVSVSNVPGTKWWVYESMSSKKIVNYSSSFWAKRVVYSGILLIIIFGFISYKLAEIWLISNNLVIK